MHHSSAENDSSLRQVCSQHLSLLKKQCNPAGEERAAKMMTKVLETDN